MIENKKIFAEIEEHCGIRKYQNYYNVKFITEYDITLFGKILKHKTEVTKVPLMFKTKEIAEDYCSIHPQIIPIAFANNNSTKFVKYYTYRILQNNKIIGYIKWCNNCINVHEDVDGIEFSPKYSLVDKFVKNIVLDAWQWTAGINDVKFEYFDNYLSNIITYQYNPCKDVVNHWKYQLVAE